MSQHDRYISPFSTRYSSDEMQYIFSDDNKFRTWRRLWVALARAEMEQVLTNITPDMVAELEAHVDDINYEVAIEREKLVRHDVMSHVYAYGQQCPKAAGIIHLGATSCYVGDNTDIIVMRQGLELIRKKLIGVLAKLGRFVAPQEVLDTLMKNGQIATQYVDIEGDPTMDQSYNPNGSVLAIEGVTSPDGRVFGKMGHSERSGEYLYKNVTGDKYQPIFEGGVDYFKI